MSKSKSTTRRCLGCLCMTGVARVIDGTALDICPPCAGDRFVLARAFNKARGEAVGIQRGGS